MNKDENEPDAKRLIIATCEKGTVEDVAAMRDIKKGLDKLKGDNPNLMALSSTEAFKSPAPEIVADAIVKRALTPAKKARAALMAKREHLRFGLPRVLNMYSYAPFLRTYLESLGVDAKHIVWSDYTSAELYKEGSRRGAIDPCFPSKLGIAHVHNLIYAKHAKKPLDYIFFPMVNTMVSDLVGTQAPRACPTVVGTPETVRAAFVKEKNVFVEHGIAYLTPILNFSEPNLLEKQLFREFAPILGLSRKENRRAVDAAYAALDHFNNVVVRGAAREVLETLEREERIGIVFLGRPYHNDPGICHEIPEEFQKLGYPIFSQDSLPIDDDILERLFGEEVRAGLITSPLDISDAWKNSYSENTNRKVWAAKFTARHPNLVAVELSNFKCGHDAPTYAVIEETIERSGTPYFSFKDIDENKPTGSIKIRVETIHYFLQRYREEFVQHNAVRRTIDERLSAYRTHLEDILRTTGSLPPELIGGESGLPRELAA